VEVVLGVGVEVVSAVVCGPPERPLLVGGRPHERHQELEDAARLVRAVREQAMQSGRDGEHPHDVERHADDDGHRAHARPEGEQAGRVHEEELDADGVVETFFRVEAAWIVA
jgi:hypothetical protein